MASSPSTAQRGGGEAFGVPARALPGRRAVVNATRGQGLPRGGGAPGSWPGGAVRDSGGTGSVGPCAGYGFVEPGAEEPGAAGPGVVESAWDEPAVPGVAVGYGGSQTVAPSGPVAVYGSPAWAAVSR